MAAKITIEPGDFWYHKDRMNDKVHTIGYLDIEKADPDIYQEDTLCF